MFKYDFEMLGSLCMFEMVFFDFKQKEEKQICLKKNLFIIIFWKKKLIKKKTRVRINLAKNKIEF